MPIDTTLTEQKIQRVRCLCLDCLYGNQPYGYFPFVCVHGKRSKTMYHEVFTCRHFEPCPEQAPTEEQEAWQIITTAD